MISEGFQQFLPPAQPAIQPVPRRSAEDGTLELRIGLTAAVAFFGVFLGWAAFAPLDAASHATGAVTVAGSRQVVQPAAAGIVSALRVKEGQRVRRGQILVELAPAELAATERALTTQVIDLQAQSARLDAETAGSPIVAPAAFASLTGADRALADTALVRQYAELAARRRAVAVQKDALGRQAAELGARIGGIGEQVAAGQRQARLFDDEVSGMKSLLDRGFASKNRVRALERAQEQLRADTAGLSAGAAAARQQIGETRLQAASLDAGALRDAIELRRQTQASLTDLLPRLGQARAELERTRIRATASGQVVGLAVTTVGAVVASGQTLMEIVPDTAKLVVTAQIAPTDADDVTVGQAAEIRLTALHDRSLPVLLGQVTRLSADSFEDKRTGQSYYTAEVVVPEDRLRALAKLHGTQNAIRPGMPVELVIPQRKRTVLQYLLEPLDRALWTSMRG